MQAVEAAGVVTRPYRAGDRPGVRAIYGQDEFARPVLMAQYPRMREHLADSLSYYTDYEPDSARVAVAHEQVVGALLGAMDTARCEAVYRRRVRPLLIRRTLTAAYGWPGWLPSLLRTEWAARQIQVPAIDFAAYPAHLHIGVLPAWRRQGIGTALMQAFEALLRARGVPGYHLYASSFHPLGVAFYRKLGLAELAHFPWRFHNGHRWLAVTETVFGRQV